VNREMLYLIQAELNYIKNNMHNGIIVLTAVCLFALVRGFNPINLICFILFIQFFSFTHISQLKERRNSQYILLGLSNNTLAIFRVVMTLIGYLLVYSLGGVSFLIFNFPPDGFHDTFAELMLFGGLSLMSVYTYLFLSDIFSLFQKKSNFILINIILGAIIMLALVITAMTIRNAYNTTSAGNIYIVFVYIGAIILSVISYITFKHRESHLGYI